MSQETTPPDPAADAAAALTMREMRRAYQLSPAYVLDKMRAAEAAMRLAACVAYDRGDDDLHRQVNEITHDFRKLTDAFGEKHRRPEEPYGIY